MHDSIFTGDILHKKWKNIRDNFSRCLQNRRKSGEGANTKVPYMYSNQLQFLRDTLEPRKTTNSLEAVVEIREEETSKCQKQVSKKRLHPVEEKIISSLERYEKRAHIEDDDDNKHFLLSLLPSLSALPKRLNTGCRLEVMQVINKFENMAHQQANENSRRRPSLPPLQQCSTEYNQPQVQAQYLSTAYHQTTQPHSSILTASGCLFNEDRSEFLVFGYDSN